MPGLKELMKPSWEMSTQASGALELAYNPKYSLLAIATADGPIVIIDIPSKTQLTLPGHDLGCSSLCWSPDGNMLVSIGQDGRLRWWDAVTVNQVLDNPSGASWGVKVVFSPDGKYLASAAGKKLMIWDDRGQNVCEYPDHASTIAGIAWRPGLEQLISCCYGSIKFWEINSQSPKRTFQWKGSMLTLALSPDGKYIATGDQDASVHFWDVKSGKDLGLSGYETKVRELTWSSDSRFLATGGAPAAVVWDTSAKGPAGTKPLLLGGFERTLSCLEFSPQNHLLAVGSKDGLLFIWDILSPNKPLGVAAFKNEISGLIWATDSSSVIAIDADGGLAGFNISTIVKT